MVFFLYILSDRFFAFSPNQIFLFLTFIHDFFIFDSIKLLFCSFFIKNKMKKRCVIFLYFFLSEYRAKKSVMSFYCLFIKKFVFLFSIFASAIFVMSKIKSISHIALSNFLFEPKCHFSGNILMSVH